MSLSDGSNESRSSSYRTEETSASRVVETSPTYQRIKELYPHLTEDIICDLLRIQRDDPKKYQLELQQARQALPPGRIGKSDSRHRALIEGLHRRPLDVRYLTVRQKELLAKKAGMEDVKEKEEMEVSTSLQKMKLNENREATTGDEDEAGQKQHFVTLDCGRHGQLARAFVDNNACADKEKATL